MTCLPFASWLMQLEASFPLAKSLFCPSSENEKLKLEKNSLPCSLNQNKTAQLTLPPGWAEPVLEPSTNQVRGAQQREWPLFLWLFLLAAAAWELWDALSGPREGEWPREGNMDRDLCCTHRHGCPRNTGSTAGTEKEPRGGKWCHQVCQGRAEFPLWPDLLCPVAVCGVTALVIKKMFGNKFFSSHFLCNATRLPL